MLQNNIEVRVRISVSVRVMVRVRIVRHGVIITVVYCTSLRQQFTFLLRDLTVWRGYNLYLFDGINKLFGSYDNQEGYG